MEEMNLKEIFNVFWKRKIGIAIILLLSISMGAVYSFFVLKPVYESYTTLLLIPENSVINSSELEDGANVTKVDFTLNSQLVTSYNELVKSKDVLKQIIDELNIENLDEESLRDNIHVSTATDAGMIEITVKNPDPNYAEMIANKVAEIFDERIADTFIENEVKIINKAEVNTVPTNINHKRDILASIFLGMIVACGYVLVSYKWNRSQKNN